MARLPHLIAILAVAATFSSTFADAAALSADRVVPISKSTDKGSKAQRKALATPAGVTAFENLVFETVGDRPLKLDLYTPEGKGPFVGVLVVHGGAWKSGKKEDFGDLAKLLAARGFAAATIDYRLSDEGKYPLPLYDCKSAVRWMRANAARYNIDPGRIAAMGGSAGGHLVALLGTTNGDKAFDGPGSNAEHSSAVQAVINMGGPMDLLTKTGRSTTPLNGPYLIGGGQEEMKAKYVEASPLTHVSGSTPPFLFLEGGNDTAIGGYVDFLARLDAHGVSHRIVAFEGGGHGCWSREPWMTPMMDEAAAWLKQTVK